MALSLYNLHIFSALNKEGYSISRKNANDNEIIVSLNRVQRKMTELGLCIITVKKIGIVIGITLWY